jgi:hypothetical protein
VFTTQKTPERISQGQVNIVLVVRKASKDEEIITMAKSLIKSWKKLVPESSDKKEKEKEKKEEKPSEKEKPAAKSFTPSSFSGYIFLWFRPGREGARSTLEKG